MKTYINIFFFTLICCVSAIAQNNQKIIDVGENNLAVVNGEKNKTIIPLNIPLNILEKPNPKYPVRENGTICVTGNVRLRVQFLASGKIGEIQPVSTLGYGLTESAVEAARNIKFEPAIKNGEIVTITKIVVFSFTIY